ncbi:GNAT family N-acetyltransferase [Thermodesulfobacteriota bacterium]
MPPGVIFGYIPGAIGRITELHADYYSKHAGFGLFFESKVASEMSEFLTRFKENQDGFWVAVEERVIGSIAIDGIKARSEGAHMRWFIVDQAYQGQGIGDMLLEKAVDFCRDSGFKRVYLWTFTGLDAARHLYEKHGFILCREKKGEQWGVVVNEQMFELIL